MTNEDSAATPPTDTVRTDAEPTSALAMIGMDDSGASKIAKTDGVGGQELAVVDPIATAMSAQLEAQVKARYAMAAYRPRDEDAARMKIERECKRPAFAEVARYDLEKHSRGSGPSARFAELAARCWGNLDAGSLIVTDTETHRRVFCYCTDLETNWTEHEMLSIPRTVERNANRVAGRTVLETRKKPSGGEVAIVRATDEEMDSKTKNYVSRTLRVLRLRHLPGDIVDTCMAIVVATQRDQQAQDPDGFRKKLLRAFMVVNVAPEDLADYLGKPFAKASSKELSELATVGRRIRDEDEYTWEMALAAKKELRNEHPSEGAPSTGGAGAGVGGALSSRRKAVKSKASKGNAEGAAPPAGDDQELAEGAGDDP